MAIRSVGVVMGILGVGFVVACSSSSGSPTTVMDAGGKPDTGVTPPKKDAGSPKDTGVTPPKKDAGAVKDTGAPVDTGADAGSGLPNLQCTGIPTTPPSNGSCITWTPAPDGGTDAGIDAAGVDAAGVDAGAGGVCGSGATTGTPACDTCLSGLPACCTSLTACNADTECTTCLGDGGTDAGCAGDAAFTALNNDCNTMTGTCETACAPPPASNSCDPVTNAGCTGTDVACDQNGDGYQCFPPPPPNNVALCGTCDGMTTTCAPGLTCVGNGQCAQYCCTDADCGPGRCDFTGMFAGGGGICITAASAEAGL